MLTKTILSNSEKLYIIDGNNADIRYDGRNNLDYRPIIIENNIIPNVDGSCRYVVLILLYI